MHTQSVLELECEYFLAVESTEIVFVDGINRLVITPSYYPSLHLRVKLLSYMQSY